MKYDYTTLLKMSKKYKTKGEWLKKDANSYSAAKYHKYLDTFTHLTSTYAVWCKEDCIKDARKYKTRLEWFTHSGNCYKAAKRHGWFDECVRHMPINCKKGL